MYRFTKNDYRIVDSEIKNYTLKKVAKQMAIALHANYAVFFTVTTDKHYRIHTWLQFNKYQKIPFPDFDDLNEFFVDANYVTDEVIKEYM